MEHERRSYWLSYLKDNATASGEEMSGRELALQSFLLHPEGACIAFPDQKIELIDFFALCTNPFLNEYGEPSSAKDYEQWKEAMHWAKKQVR